MEEYNAEKGLQLLNLAGISLPNDEVNMFKVEFDKIYDSSNKGYDFIEAVWKVYSNILPIEAYPDDKGASSFRTLARDKIFQEKVIDSEISKKLKSGVSLAKLVKDSNINSFS